MSKNSFISAALSFLVLFQPSCNREKKVGDEVRETEVIAEDIVEMRADQVEIAKIQTGLIEIRSMGVKLKVNGIVVVSPQHLATICAPMGGFVRNATLMPGNRVYKGQTLAVIENQEFVDIQQSYLEAKSRFEYAEAEYKRHSELFNEDVYSQNNVQQVTADYKTLKAQVKAFEQKLALIGIDPCTLSEDNISRSIAIKSPIDGYVKAMNVNLGKYVAPTDPIFEIVNSDKLILELTLFEKDADKAAVGQKIRFFINNEAEEHEAIISQTGKSINDDKTFKVFANVTGHCKNLLPGMFVNALIEASANRVTALPSDAVVSFDDKDYIFVFEKEKEEGGKPFTEYRMIEVNRGITDEGYTQVILPEDIDIKSLRVVVSGAYNLLSAKKNAGEMAC